VSTPIHDLLRLPKWARDHIRIQRDKIASLEKQLAEQNNIVKRETQVGILVEPYADHVKQLPIDTRLRFWIEPDEFAIDVVLAHGLNRLSGSKRSLYISGYGHRKSSSLVVHPSASNALHVTSEDR